MKALTRHLTYANVAATLALFLALGGTAYAATGGNFILGRSNSASSTTSLTSSSNTATLALYPKAGYAPLYSASTKVAQNLNADLLDGHSSTYFAYGSGQTGQILAFDGDDGTSDGFASAACPSGSKMTGGGGVTFVVGDSIWGNAPTAANEWSVGDNDGGVSGGDQLFAVAICYNPQGAVPGALSAAQVRALTQKGFKR